MTLKRKLLVRIPKGGGRSVQADWNQTDDTMMDFIRNKPDIADMLRRIEALEGKTAKPAYAVATAKPTQATIADIVDPTATKPTEAITVDMSSLTRPIMCYIVYPQAWEVVVDDIIQIPYMVDANGFEIGATFDAETPLLTTGGVVFRVLDIRLGKGVYKLNFKR